MGKHLTVFVYHANQSMYIFIDASSTILEDGSSIVTDVPFHFSAISYNCEVWLTTTLLRSQEVHSYFAVGLAMPRLLLAVFSYLNPTESVNTFHLTPISDFNLVIKRICKLKQS